MEKIVVIGTGLMGNSITLSIAWGNFPVTVFGLNHAEIKKAQKDIKHDVSMLIDSEIINENNAQDILSRIGYSTDLKEAVRDGTFIIEAVPEKLSIKQELFQQLEKYCNKDTVFASNSSSLPPSKIAKKLQYQERVLGAHFWNPAHLIPLVEIIKGNKTKDVFIKRAQQLLLKINKQPILVNKEVVGFVGNRLQFALLREAQYLYETGVASIEDIDKAVQLSIGRRLGVTGPFLSADLGGLDVFKSISDYTFSNLSNEEKASESINQLVNENHLGEKSGRGYYNWHDDFGKKIKQKRKEELIHWLKKDIKNI